MPSAPKNVQPELGSRDHLKMTLYPLLALIEEGSNIIPVEIRGVLKEKIENVLYLIQCCESSSSQELSSQLNQEAREVFDLVENL